MNWVPDDTTLILSLVLVLVLWQLNSLNSPKKPNTSIHPPPTMWAGQSFLIGLVLALVVAGIVYGWIFKGFGLLDPVNIITGKWYRFVANGLSLLGAFAVAALFFFLGFYGRIPIGYKGVATVWGGKRSPFEILHPEGWAWTIPLFTGVKPVDMRMRPLIAYEDPTDEQIDIEANVLVMPAPESTPQTTTLSDMEKLFFAKVHVKVAVRVQNYNPYTYLGATGAEDFLYSQIEEEVRLWVVDKQIFELPKLKADLTNHLEEKLDNCGKEMGIDFIRIAVVDIILPKEISEEAAQIPVELIQRSKEKYQAETIEQMVIYLRRQLPNLSDRELKNMAMAISKLATSQTYSFEGNTPMPLVPVGPQPHSDGGHHG